jgi:hypothetical protein
MSGTRRSILILSKMATTPMLLVCNEASSPFNNLELEWSRQGKTLPIELGSLPQADDVRIGRALREDLGTLQVVC